MSDNKKAYSGNIIYMLRTAQQHHVQLSLMADQKANFLLSASFVLLSILSVYIAQGKMSLTLLYIGLVLAIAATFAVLTVSPRFKAEQTNVDDNPLFFGNFAHLSFDEFYGKIESKMESDEEVYKAMSKDIYSIGQVLNNKKYRYLNHSYRVFYFGILLFPVIAIIDLFLIQKLTF